MAVYKLDELASWRGMNRRAAAVLDSREIFDPESLDREPGVDEDGGFDFDEALYAEADLRALESFEDDVTLMGSGLRPRMRWEVGS